MCATAPAHVTQVGLCVPFGTVRIANVLNLRLALHLLPARLMDCAVTSMATQTYPILLVEDDLPLLECLESFLRDHQFETHCAATRAQAELLLRQTRPSICLLDLNLPDGSGMDILRLIVAEQLPVKVIVMSAFPMAHLKMRFPPTVLKALLTKPVSPDQLIQAVDTIMREHAT